MPWEKKVANHTLIKNKQATHWNAGMENFNSCFELCYSDSFSNISIWIINYWRYSSSTKNSISASLKYIIYL